MLNTLNLQRVEFLRTYTPLDLLRCIRVQVYTPTYCLSKSRKSHPMRCSFLDFEIRVRKGYPHVPAVACFCGNKILESPNMNHERQYVRNVRHADNRLAAVVKDVIHAIYEGADPCLSRELLAWQEEMQQRGRFPAEMMECYFASPPRCGMSPLVLHPRIHHYHPVPHIRKWKKK